MPSTIYPTDAYGNIDTVTGNQTITGAKTFLAGSATSTPIIIRTNVSQSADAFNITNSTASAIYFSIDKDGVAYLNGNGAAGYAARISTNSSTNKGLVILGAASQSANLLEWTNNSGTPLGNIDGGGNINLLSGTTLSILNTQTAARFGSDTNVYSKVHINVAAADTTQVGLTVRNMSGSTSDYQQWVNSGGTVIARITSAGLMFANGGVQNSGDYFSTGVMQAGRSQATGWIGGTVSSQPRGAGEIGMVVRGYASQTADLQQWQNSSGTLVANIQAGGNLYVNSDVTFSGGVLYGGAAINSSPPYMSSTLNLYTYVPGGTGAKGITIRGQASQTGNYLEIQNSGATVIGYINSSGAYINSSSLMIKNAVTDFTAPSALTAINSLRPISYKLNGAEDGPTLHSFAVEEAHEVAPEIVDYVDGKPHGINLLSTITMLAAAVKELSDKFDSLQSTLPKATG